MLGVAYALRIPQVQLEIEEDVQICSSSAGLKSLWDKADIDRGLLVPILRKANRSMVADARIQIS